MRCSFLTVAFVIVAAGYLCYSNAFSQTAATSPSDLPPQQTAADIKDHTANLGILESMIYFDHCAFGRQDTLIVREAYGGFVKRLAGVKVVRPDQVPMTLSAKDCHELATEIKGIIGWHAREGDRPAYQE